MPRQGEFSDPAAIDHATAVLGPLMGFARIVTAWVPAIRYSVWTCGPCCTCTHTPPPHVHSCHMYIVCGGWRDGTANFSFVLYSGSWILSFSCVLLAGQGGSSGCCIGMRPHRRFQARSVIHAPSRLLSTGYSV